MNNEQIVNTIKSICKEHDITITKLEETLGMSQGLISRWNKSDPSLSKIIDIANHFNMSLDELTGYKNTINDKFIEKLILETSNQNLIWHKYTNNMQAPKQYLDPYFEQIAFLDQNDAREYFESHVELSYFSKIRNGYISIYCYYENDNIKNPSEIKLFIQPTDNASLIFQNYTKEQLISLWLKILYALNEEAPDIIKAEELKNSFINDMETPSFFKNFKNSDLSGADFSGADFTGANLSNAILTNADLTCVDLAYANLSNANLSNANLKGSLLRNTLIEKSIETQ